MIDSNNQWKTITVDVHFLGFLKGFLTGVVTAVVIGLFAVLLYARA